ncbi:MAG: HAD family hydrolase [Candidatus Thiodiazotropha sp.]
MAQDYDTRQLVMFDIDGTLVESYDFDAECFQDAVREVLDIEIDTDWHHYRHVSDTGILLQVLDEQGIQTQQETLIRRIRHEFTDRIASHLASEPMIAVPGARELFEALRQREDVTLALATGGWSETARLKLIAAGFDIHDVPLASSSHHYDRIEIMKQAERLCAIDAPQRRTYFGDGPWDVLAAKALGYEFVLVGDRVDHTPSIADYQDLDRVLRLLELSPGPVQI